MVLYFWPPRKCLYLKTRPSAVKQLGISQSATSPERLYRGPGMGLKLHLHKCRHMDRLYLGEVPNVVLGAKGGERPHCLPVGRRVLRLPMCKLKNSHIGTRASGRTVKIAPRLRAGETCDASYPTACGEASKMSRALLWFSAVLWASGSCGVPV
jgi:hypothetical protein